MIREAVTAAWEQLLTFPPKPLRWPNKPLTKRSLRGFSLSCFSSVKRTVSPPQGGETLSIGQLFKLLPDSPRSASGMNKDTNMTGMLRNRNSGWEMLSWRKYGFPHPVFWVQSYLKSSLRCFDVSLKVFLFFEKQNRNGLQMEWYLKIWFSRPSLISPTRDDFNIKVLQAFVELHEFADLNLVQALRSAQWLTQILSRKKELW